MKMDLIEFAENKSPVPLSDYQKKILKMYDDARKEGKSLFVCCPLRSGKGMIMDIIKQFDMEEC